jgi:hypothetical protein
VFLAKAPWLSTAGHVQNMDLTNSSIWVPRGAGRSVREILRASEGGRGYMAPDISEAPAGAFASKIFMRSSRNAADGRIIHLP